MSPENDISQIYNTVTLLLAEKRTSLSILRTAIAIFTLPLSVFTILIATSRYYDVTTVLHFVIPLCIICLSLLFFGIYLVVRSFKKIKEIDHRIRMITAKEACIQEILEDIE